MKPATSLEIVTEQAIRDTLRVIGQQSYASSKSALRCTCGVDEPLRWTEKMLINDCPHELASSWIQFSAIYSPLSVRS